MRVFNSWRALLKPISLTTLFKAFSKKSLLGIDLGRHTIKIVRLGQKGELLDFGTHIMPFEGWADDKRDEYTLLALKALKEQLKLKQKEVAISLPAKHVITKKIELPAMKKEELNKAILVEAEQYIPYNLDEVNLSYEVLSENGEKRHIEVLIAAARKEIVERYIAILTEAGFIPCVLDVENFALANAYEICYGKNEEPVALIDIGASKISILVLINNVPVFAREVPSGGIYLTRKIQEKLKIELEEAEKIKIESTPDENLLESLKEALVEVTNEWLQEIKTALEFFEQNAGTKIEGAILCGGSSRIVGFQEALARYLQKEVYGFNLFGKIHYNVNRFDPAYLQYWNLQAPIAFGLALRDKVET
ncbi:MAG TPA: type IV pilus assembly protein PilM [Candidatus Desulfofervidus auxilii]|uniref:Type IV pilus assembly protein PilM n=1 Tax=Desulfofervidus auxilii TaxID=1621989 RepID=A0A7V0I9S3_DESA2|nr:type IV pilus assembly protein PilM [Candidatus Desulfofervidus auxilii]